MLNYSLGDDNCNEINEIVLLKKLLQLETGSILHLRDWVKKTVATNSPSLISSEALRHVNNSV